MGCSTFGQIAGTLTAGLRFFSTACEGDQTPRHYKLMPPLAMAEGGKSWVPVKGSWRDPVLLSEEILRVELENLLGNNARNIDNFNIRPDD